MQVRHRIPTIFSLYMVDVLCCALGCVVLLWQLYHYESQEEAAKARAANAEVKAAYDRERSIVASLQAANDEIKAKNDALKLAHLSINSLTSEVGGLKLALDAKNKREVQLTLELDDSLGKLDKAEKLALVRKKEYDQLQRDKNLVEVMLANLRIDHKTLEQQKKLTATQLAEKIKAYAGLLDRISLLEKELSIRAGDLLASKSKIDNQVAELKTADERTRKLEKLLQQLRADNKEFLGKLSDAEIRARLLAQDLQIGKKDYRDLQRRFEDLLSDKESLNSKLLVNAKDLDGSKLALVAIQGERENLKGKLMLSLKELADIRVAVNSLQGDKLTLIKQNRAIQAAADNRFAGITLTGTKVVFMVDMSGSMELLDEKTGDPDKWPLVCEIVGKLMKSLPDLKEYQVIMFSDKVRYPLANEGRWLTYHPEQSVKSTVAALKAIKPKNETNLYVAFEETFKYRDQGMDAIYLFSDGLPNAGPGLPPGGDKLSESEQGVHLGRYLRGKMKTWNQPVSGKKVIINAVGFFFESPDVGAFLWALAREHDGSFVGMSRP